MKKINYIKNKYLILNIYLNLKLNEQRGIFWKGEIIQD